MPQKKEDGEEEEEEDEEEEEEEEEAAEVFLGIPCSLPGPEDGYFARFGGSSQTHECATCPKAGSDGGGGVVVEVCTVFAPFGELTSRQLAVCVCQQCGSITVLRRQPSSRPVANTTVEAETNPLLFEDASATSLDELNALLVASSVKPKQSQKKKTKAPPAATTTAPTGVLVEFVLEPGLADDDFSHEDLLLQRYNKEAAELGEEQVVAGNTTAATSLSSESFYERLAREPRQLMRYAYGSTPLFPSLASKAKAMKRGIPPCPSCGAARGFEFQLTPQALLHFQHFANLPLAEWCTVLVFTCQDSCAGGHSEVAVVLGEEA